MDKSRPNRLRTRATLAGALVALIGLVPMVGYFLHRDELIQFRTSFPPVAFSTALGFVLCGLGLIAVEAGKPRLALPGGGYALLVGLLTMLDTALNGRLHIAGMLMPYGVAFNGEVQSQMSTPSTLAWVLVGLALLGTNLRRAARILPPLLGTLGSAILAIGGAALFGFLFRLETIYTWSALKPMALLSAVGFSLMGGMLISLALRLSRQAPATPHDWQPILLGASTLFGSLFFWGLLGRVLDPNSGNPGNLAERGPDILLMATAASLLIASFAYLIPPRDPAGRSSPVIRMLLLGIVLPFFGGITCDIFSHTWQWRVELPALHSLLAGLGSFVALLLAMLVILKTRGTESVGHRRWLACGLLAVGTLEAFHAGVGLNGSSVWLHTAGACLGGLCFLGVWLPEPAMGGRTARVAPWLTLAIAVLLGTFTLIQPDLLPPMLYGGDFSLAAKLGNAIAGSLFILAAVRLVVRFRLRRDTDDLLFATLSLLLGGAGLLFPQSTLWDADWWFWHVMQLIAYLVAGSYIVRNMVITQQAIRALNVELERRVRERTAELEAAYRELEAFSYTVSHDLRAPLRAIDGFSRILAAEHAVALSPEARRLIDVIRANARRMGQLIDDLLMFARFSRQPLNRQPVPPAVMVRQVLEDLAPACEGRQIDIEIGELPVCQADPSLLRQVWMNLLTNAVKFTGRRAQARIEVGSGPDKQTGRTVYFVRDNGAGFDMAYADQLFRVFHRLHRPDEFEGTGIGLATVERIVTRHGGRVWAEAAVEKGATFYFTLE